MARSAAAGPRRQDQKRAKTQDAGSALDHVGRAGFQGLRRGAGNARNAKRERVAGPPTLVTLTENKPTHDAEHHQHWDSVSPTFQQPLKPGKGLGASFQHFCARDVILKATGVQGCGGGEGAGVEAGGKGQEKGFVGNEGRDWGVEGPGKAGEGPRDITGEISKDPPPSLSRTS